MHGTTVCGTDTFMYMNNHSTLATIMRTRKKKERPNTINCLSGLEKYIALTTSCSGLEKINRDIFNSLSSLEKVYTYLQ